LSGRTGISSDGLLTGVAVWVCTLPLLALLVVPRFGAPIAAGAVIVTLIVSLTLCCVVLRSAAPSR